MKGFLGDTERNRKCVWEVCNVRMQQEFVLHDEIKWNEKVVQHHFRYIKLEYDFI